MVFRGVRSRLNLLAGFGGGWFDCDVDIVQFGVFFDESDRSGDAGSAGRAGDADGFLWIGSHGWSSWSVRQGVCLRRTDDCAGTGAFCPMLLHAGAAIFLVFSLSAVCDWW
jgi:hypothetical protein